MIFTDEELAVEKEYYALIKPTDWEMEAGAMAVNGLTMEKLHAEGVPIADALAIYSAAVIDGRAVGAHNAQFDVKMMRAELRRAGMDDLFEKTPNVCTMRATAEVMRIAPTNKMMAAGYKKFKPPKLLEAYRFLFNRDFPGAHTATGDAMACLEILRELKRNGALPAPEIHYAKEGTKAGEALKARQQQEQPDDAP
jgi:DNA polymerase III epsilon subunit-like protein